MRRIYVETTIPSFYFEVRTEPTMVSRRLWTRKWFDIANQVDELVTSAAVIEELERGDFPGRVAAIELVEGLSVPKLVMPLELIGSGNDDERSSN